MITDTEKIDTTPTWEYAVQIYAAVLQNESAPYESRQAAVDELLKLARIVDGLKETR